MTAWIVLTAVAALAAGALRHGHPKDPPLPGGYDGERQLAELRALAVRESSSDPPNGPTTSRHVHSRPRPAKQEGLA